MLDCYLLGETFKCCLIQNEAIALSAIIVDWQLFHGHHIHAFNWWTLKMMKNEHEINFNGK